MNTFHDNSPKNRLLAVLKDLLNRPYHYTKKMLVAKYGVSKDSISSDFNELRDADFILTFDHQYRYAIVPSKSQEHLEDLLFFTEPEKEMLLEALARSPTIKLSHEKVREKLATVYDVSKLGSSLFSKTFLTKANLLEQAKKEKRQVRLIQYRSTHSNQVTDRLVEPFWVGIKEDIIQAYDHNAGAIRHFRLSRVERIELLPDPWHHETKHYVMATDPFQIVQDQQVAVHLRLKTGAYNELLERFPLAQAYVRPCARDAGVFDFEAKVNAQFYGITNFILGYHEHILEIVEPESLREHIRKHVARINF